MRSSENCSGTTFIEVDICHGMGCIPWPWPSFSRSKVVLLCICYKKNAQAVDVPGRFASTRTDPAVELLLQLIRTLHRPYRPIFVIAVSPRNKPQTFLFLSAKSDNRSHRTEDFFGDGSCFGVWRQFLLRGACYKLKVSTYLYKQTFIQTNIYTDIFIQTYLYICIHLSSDDMHIC